mmetsp:Transcript_52749/g.112874  ORF Transcript_52749/g.112874 Transcript_52749/m.112874 type:complete len:324 (+) Transcript_52749:2458-3429(+)
MGSGEAHAADEAPTAPHAPERKGYERAAPVGPAVIETVLLCLAQVLLMLLLIQFPAPLDEPERLEGYLLVFVAEPRQEIGKEVRLVVALVWNAQEYVGQGLEEEAPDRRVPVETQCRQVVYRGHRLVKRLDGHLVLVLPRDQDLQNLEVVLPHAAVEDCDNGTQGCDSDLGVIVSEAGGQRTAHGLSEVQQHLRVVVAEGNHGLARQRLNLVEGIHCLRPQEACGLVDVGVDLPLVATSEEHCDEVTKLKAHFLAVLDRPCDLRGLLLRVRAHGLWQVCDPVQVLTAKTSHKRGEDVGQHHREVRRVLDEAPQDLHCQLAALL